MKRKGTFSVVLGVIFLMIIWGAYTLSNSYIQEHMLESMDNSLKEAAESDLAAFELQMEEQMKNVKTAAAFIGKGEKLDDEAHLAYLQSAVEQDGLLQGAIVFLDGSYVTHYGERGTGAEKQPFFQEILKKKGYISNPEPNATESEQEALLFAYPVFHGKEVVGAVTYAYACQEMYQKFRMEFASGQGQMLVIKEDGRLLIGNSPYIKTGENLLEFLRETCTHEGHRSDERFTIQGDSDSWLITPKDDDVTLYCRYDKLPYHDWYMLSVLPEKTEVRGLGFVESQRHKMNVFIGGCILLYGGILFAAKRIRNRYEDKMTGVLTIEGFRRKTKAALRQAPQEKFVVIQLDIKDFKLINRIYGFEMGDRVIRCISDALHMATKGMNVVIGRISVDTFVLLMPYEGAAWLTRKRELFLEYFQNLIGENFSGRISFPTGQYVLSKEDVEHRAVLDMMEKVNFAHRAAKHNYNAVVEYEEGIEEIAILEKKVEDRMDDALSGEEFALYLQPKYRLSDEKICGAEALVRWKVDRDYFIYPTDFIPILEKNGFIVQLDKYMFECTVKKLREWIDQGIEPIPISVNFSRHHLGNGNFVQELCSISDKYQVPRKYLEIELTESAIFGLVGQITALISTLHEAGFRLSMDDFGSGYSCLAQLKDLEIDTLKIDKGFFDSPIDANRAYVVVAGVLDMAQKLKITTVAEGIESREQLDMLRDLGCDIVQGFVYSKAVPAQMLDEMLEENRKK